MRTKAEWKKEFLELKKADQEDVVRGLARKIERFGGELPPDRGHATVEYARELYERMKEAKRKYDAHMDEMLTLDKDGGYMIQSQTSGDPLELWPETDRGAIALSNGDGVSFFTPLEVRRIILLLRDMAEQLELKMEEATP